jgi:hypothetical protein
MSSFFITIDNARQIKMADFWEVAPRSVVDTDVSERFYCYYGMTLCLCGIAANKPTVHPKNDNMSECIESVEWYRQEETERFGKVLSTCHFFHHVFYTDCPGSNKRTSAERSRQLLFMLWHGPSEELTSSSITPHGATSQNTAATFISLLWENNISQCETSPLEVSRNWKHCTTLMKTPLFKCQYT